MNLLRVYKRSLSVVIKYVFGGGCRFTPTCSKYAAEAIEVHGALGGSVLAFRRVAKCHPWGSSGFDPVPPKAR